MFKKAAHRGLTHRLTTQGQVNEGVAYALASACYPTRKNPLPFEPRLGPSEAAAAVDRWEQTGQPDLRQLCANVFGEENLDDLEEWVRLSEFLKNQGM